MNRTGDEFLAGSRLALHEDVRVRRRDKFDLLEGLFERGALTDDFSKPDGITGLFSKVLILFFEFVFQSFYFPQSFPKFLLFGKG